jgi:pimeloyl-ACP methyl ester carboxylesterase
MGAASVFYLHGFGSSAGSTKAAFLRERFQERGVTLHCPDFNEPDFTTLTLTRMLERLDRELVEAASLIGSSLGGALAVLGAAAFASRVERLVLLAPAVMLGREGHELLPPSQLAEWRRLGRMPFFHYGDNAPRLLDFAFHEDCLRYNPFETVFSQPALVFQGVHDATVDPRTVEAFARARPNVTLSLLEDDHQLTNSLVPIWEATSAFLEIR